MTNRQGLILKMLRDVLADLTKRHPQIEATDILYALEKIRYLITEEVIKRDMPQLRPPALPSVKRKPYA